MKFGTPIAQFAQPFSPGQVDFLGQTVSPAGATVTINANNVKNSYNAIVVRVGNPGGASVSFGQWVKVVTGAGATFSGAFPPQPTIAALALPNYETTVGCANSPGDNIAITVQFLAIPPTGTVITVLGFTGTMPMRIRADGRNYPMGQQYIASTSNPILNAPTSASRYLLKSFYTNGNQTGGSANYQVTATISGLAVLLGAALAPNIGFDNIIQPDGLLLDPATAITLVTSGAFNFGVYISYDLVPA